MSLLNEIHARNLTIGDEHATATAMCADLKLSARQVEALFPLLLGFCANIERSRVRGAEARAELHRKGRPVNRTVERASVMTETFSWGTGERIEWGKATTEHHQLRIDYLQRHVVGVQATIQRHKVAIEQIVAAGVSCLNDLKAVAA